MAAEHLPEEQEEKRVHRIRQAIIHAFRGKESLTPVQPEPCRTRNAAGAPSRRSLQRPSSRKRRRRKPPLRKTCRRSISPPS